MDFEFVKKLIIPGQSKIVLLVMDGLGGLPRDAGGKTELETAQTPNLDLLASQSDLGLSQPAGAGITVGSGPGHQAIFGYDPIIYEIGRGALEVLGVDFKLQPGDIAARGNFCNVDEDGIILDRRAGRLPTDLSRQLIDLLRTIKIAGVEFFLEPIKEHRFAFVMRGDDLGTALSVTDPYQDGLAPLLVKALNPDSEKSAKCLNEFINRARLLLAEQNPANMILLRGFAQLPTLPQYPEYFGLKPAAIANNGMYRGVARLVGMTVLDVPEDTIESEFDTLQQHWDEYDYFFIHIKATDTYGADGDFDGKVGVIEEVDALLPRLLALQPDVVVVSGDHSTPAVMKSHSWHPVPTLIHSKFVRPDDLREFGERACARGNLGIIDATDIILHALANAGRIKKYGA
jgi:2,3-bisphosphoglycerate-independent phosphoglycerate mutase